MQEHEQVCLSWSGCVPAARLGDQIGPLSSSREAHMQLESANFEIKSIDVLGVHYSATLHRWYLNWVSNKEKVVAKYGIRWYRIWVYFLAYSVMYVLDSVRTLTIQRLASGLRFGIPDHMPQEPQWLSSGGASAVGMSSRQIEGVPSHQAIHAPISRKTESVRCL